MTVYLRKYLLSIAAFWTLVIGILLWTGVNEAKQQMLDLARTEARGLFNRYSVFINPKYMTSEFHGLGGEANGGLGRITSLKPSNPKNAADAWETAALHALGTGVRETSSIEAGHGESRLRYMGPLTMGEQCLACHADGGYGLGQVCGGVSVSVPMATYFSINRAQTQTMILTYSALWVLGLLGLGTGARRLEKRVAEGNQAAEAMRASEERFRVLFEGSRDAIMTLEPPTWGFTSGNPATVAMFRAKNQDEFIAFGPGDLSPERQPDGCPSADRAKEMIETALREGSNFFEWTHARIGGEEFPATVLLTRMEHAGKVILQATVRDITGQRRAEQTLRESESRLSAIADSAHDAILMVDPEGTISFWNPAAWRIFGHTSAEAIGKNLHELLVPQHYHETQRAAFTEFLRSGQGAAVGKTLELQALRKDGREITVSLSLSAVQINQEWHAVGVLRDITAQNRAAEELRRSKEQLEQTNLQLEAAVGQANLMAVEAQTANIAKSQFLANMSHEVRTPMNGIIGMTGLLMDTDLSEEQRQYAEVVRSSGEALLSLVNEILDFSKIESDRLELEELDFDLRAMLEETAELLALRAHEKRLEFICHISPEVPTFLRGDPGRLRQILINLGGNAIKFTSEGEIVIEVRLESESDERIKARFEVRDTGIGIPQDKVGLLFNAFQQVDASTTRRFGGTGLGLAISKRLAAMMGGEIGIESVEGKGTSFWFTALFGRQLPGEHREEAPRADVRGVRALAVDDNATNRLVLSEQLASWGVRHAEAESAGQALEMLHAARAEGDPYRIVLTDMQMPDMDGESLGEAIKADPGLRETILVMMTSLGTRGDAKRLEAIGFAAYLTKPVKQSQLYDCLATVLGVADPSRKASKTAIVTRHTIGEAQRRKVRILLAEDNPTNQQVALRILEKLGFRADAVANGQEAINSLETLPYDIVFMDVQMPVMDGFEATRAIRSGNTKAPNSEIPIIAMTAHAMKGDRERCIEAGMDDYISKPIAPGALAAALDKWLGQDVQEQPPVADAPAAQSKPSPKRSVFDRQSLMELMGGDGHLVDTIIAGFLEDMSKQVAALRKHVAEGEAGLAGGLGHAIKGAAANMRCMALSSVAFDIEKAGRAGRMEGIAALMPELERQFDLVKAHIWEDATCES